MALSQEQVRPVERAEEVAAHHAVMLDNVKELMAGRMKENCEHKWIRLNSSVLYSPSLNRVTG